MLGWLVRIILAVAGVITGWFVARDDSNFSLIEMAVGLLFITFCIACAAYGPAIVARLRNRTTP